MLDDLKRIAERDHHDALGLIEKQPQQLEYSFEVPLVSSDIENIVHSGMGGSALWANVAASWPGCNKPFQIVQDYTVPAYVNEKTLFIASSFSGNTEETISSVTKALAQNAQVVVITSGGKLEELAHTHSLPLMLLPKIDKPRYGMLYGYNALVHLFDTLKLSAVENASQQLSISAQFLREEIARWIPTVTTKDNLAKKIAQELMGKSPVIYSGQLLRPSAHKWKIDINENAKNVAWTYTFPEFNHNEFTGWTSHPVEKPYSVVYLQSSFDHPRVTQRFTLSETLLSGRWPSPEHIEVQGETELEQILWAAALGDFVSAYLALLNNVSPIDVGDNDIIEKFKKELGTYELN